MVNLGDAVGGARFHGLHKEGIACLPGKVYGGLGVLPQLEDQGGGHCHPGQGGQLVGPVLVHTQGGGQGAAAHHRNTGQLQQPLHSAVLSVFSMENGQGVIHPDHLVPGGGKGQEPVDRAVLGDHHRSEASRVLRPGVRGDPVIGAGVVEPLAALGNPHGKDRVSVWVQVG